METKISNVMIGEDLDAVRDLIQEYETLLRSHHHEASLEGEIRMLPEPYVPPDGLCLLIRHNGRPAGCVVLRKLEPGVCELRRLYVRKEFRGLGLGRKLTEYLCDEARQLGYKKMRLLSMPFMAEAMGIYLSLGFVEIEPYRKTTAPGPKYMEADLDRPA